MSKTASRAALALICVTAAVLMFNAAWSESAIMDELAHIPAGYGYVSRLDYRLNPEHPPLLKALAAAPLLLIRPNFPVDYQAWQTEINGQWDMGAKFLYNSGNNATELVRTARIIPVLLTLLFIILVYHVARKRLGRLWALLPAALTAFSPIVLAHGHYVTTDLAAAFGVLLASWRFIELLEKPTAKNLWYAGLSLGVAELLKFSAVLLVPYFAGLAVIHFLAQRKISWLKYARNLILTYLIGYALVVYPVYYLFTVNYPPARQAADAAYTLSSFAGGPTPAGAQCNLKRCAADLDIRLSSHRLTQPLAQYALGVLMVFQRSSGGNTDYFMGQVSAIGSHLYFPAVYTLKETLPALIVILAGLMMAIAGTFAALRRKGAVRSLRDYLSHSFPEFSYLLFVVFYWAYSVQSPLNIGVRHVLPTIPLMYILAASAWKRSAPLFGEDRGGSPMDMIRAAAKSVGRMVFKAVFLSILIIWSLGEAIAVAPHFLSYFNEAAGGTVNGYRFVTDSNYDWGQDLLYLSNFVKAHPEIDKIAVDYFGGGNPAYYLGSKETDWDSGKGDPRRSGISWLAVSVNSLQSAIQPTAPGFERKAEDSYPWLTAFRKPSPGMGGLPEPDYRIGTSIFVYHLQ